MTIKHINILTNSADSLSKGYVIDKLALCWKKQGIKVTAGQRLNKRADLGILHIDLTCIDPLFVNKNNDAVPILNSKVLDISKRQISLNLVHEDSEYQGSVIIKTNENFFGIPELKSRPISIFKRIRRFLTNFVPWQLVRELPMRTYPIIQKKSDVPSWVWNRDDLVIERFTPEMDNNNYVLRSWLFIGNQDYVVKITGSDPVVKAGNSTGYEILNTVPDELRLRRKELSIDYGKFDYVIVDGKVILLDVNKTPTFSKKRKDGIDRNLMQLASGIKFYKEI